MVADPLPGVAQGLVIAGSDRRGTAYGVYELSRRIGVSPWYWWADVTPAHRDALHVSPQRVKLGPPAVKYRGIFINDEMWGIRPWAAENFAPDEGPGLGRSGDTVTVLPPTTPSRTEPADIAANSPALEYDFYLFAAGVARLDLDCLPTKPITPNRGTRVAVSLDDGAPEILTGRGGDVLANLRRITTSIKVDQPGHHTLTIWMVDPGVVIDKIVLYAGAPRDSYLGPPESYRDGTARSAFKCAAALFSARLKL